MPQSHLPDGLYSDNPMRTKHPHFEELQLDLAEIFRTMGSSRYAPDPAMRSETKRLIAEAAQHCQPHYIYTIYPCTKAGTTELVVGEERFRIGTILAKSFTAATHCAAFAATAGMEFDCWMHGEEVAGDILLQFIVDAIGSEIAEATVRLTVKDVAAQAGQRQMNCGNPYSPGYCGWNIAEQHRLFRLLPSNPCGIRLNASGLMTPIKSVSGIVPLGRDVVKMAYGCAICNKKDCYKNRIKD